MVTLLVDANLDGQAALIEMRLRTETWPELHEHLDIQFIHLDDLELDRTAKDDVLWRRCQAHGYYLLTANRNHDSDDSLEATIRREGTADSLAVLTLADAQRVYDSASYLDRVVERLLDYLLNQQNYRGAGRLFLP